MVLGDHEGPEHLLSVPSLTGSVTVTKRFWRMLLPKMSERQNCLGGGRDPKTGYRTQTESLARRNKKNGKWAPPFFLQTGIWKCFTSLHFVVSIKIPFQQFYFQKCILQKCLHKGTKIEVQGCS